MIFLTNINFFLAFDIDTYALHLQGATIDLNLPRRSLLVQFTCGVCGERTKRLVNRLAYERGAVFVQVSIISRVFVNIYNDFNIYCLKGVGILFFSFNTVFTVRHCPI